MTPVLGRVVVVPQQRLLVLGEGDLPDGRLRLAVLAFWQRVQHVHGFMHPVALAPSLGKHVPQRIPETKRSIAYRYLRRSHAALLEVSQQTGPALGGFPVSIPYGHQLLRAVQTGA